MILWEFSLIYRIGTSTPTRVTSKRKYVSRMNRKMVNYQHLISHQQRLTLDFIWWTVRLHHLLMILDWNVILERLNVSVNMIKLVIFLRIWIYIQTLLIKKILKGIILSTILELFNRDRILWIQHVCIQQQVQLLIILYNKIAWIFLYYHKERFLIRRVNLNTIIIWQ